MSKKLIVLGDSYSTPYVCVDPKDSFWGLAAKDLQVENIINYSHSGFAFDLILHVLLNEQFDWENSYFLVGVPVIARLGMFKESTIPVYNSAYMCNDKFESWKIGCNSLTNCRWGDFIEMFDKEKYFLSNYEHSWQEVLTLEKILLIHSFLTSKRTKFIIANLTVPMLLQETWEVGGHVMRTCNQLNECILFKNTLHDLNQADNIKPVDRDPLDPDCWFGHHGAEGNFNWYQKVLNPKMKELGWL